MKETNHETSSNAERLHQRENTRNRPGDLRADLVCNFVCLNAIICYHAANEEINMFAIGTAPGYRLPFTTAVVDRVSFTHTHRDAFNNSWKETMTMDIHLLAFRTTAVRPANNDNKQAARHGS
jgi:hypothetical protein